MAESTRQIDCFGDEFGLFMDLAGFRVYCHEPRHDRGVSLGVLAGDGHEAFREEWVGKYVRPGDVAVDVGANIGLYTLALARAVGPAGWVFAFEPEPKNFLMLQRNLVLNGCANVGAFRTAVCRSSGCVRLHLSDSNSGDHRVYPVPGEGRDSFVNIPAVSLDDFLAGGEVNFLKVDVQGAELDVLRGAQRLIASQPRLAMLVEYWPQGLRQAGGSAAELGRLLQDAGFRVSQVRDQDGLNLAVPVDDLAGLFPTDSSRFCDLLCLKGY